MTTNLTGGTRIAYILMGIISCIAGVWMFMYPGLNTPHWAGSSAACL